MTFPTSLYLRDVYSGPGCLTVPDSWKQTQLVSQGWHLVCWKDRALWRGYISTFAKYFSTFLFAVNSNANLTANLTGHPTASSHEDVPWNNNCDITDLCVITSNDLLGTKSCGKYFTTVILLNQSWLNMKPFSAKPMLGKAWSSLSYKAGI